MNDDDDGGGDNNDTDHADSGSRIFHESFGVRNAIHTQATYVSNDIRTSDAILFRFPDARVIQICYLHNSPYSPISTASMLDSEPATTVSLRRPSALPCSRFVRGREQVCNSSDRFRARRLHKDKNDWLSQSARVRDLFLPKAVKGASLPGTWAHTFLVDCSCLPLSGHLRNHFTYASSSFRSPSSRVSDRDQSCNKSFYGRSHHSHSGTTNEDISPMKQTSRF